MCVENLMDPTRIKWIDSTGPDGDIVISSRVRLARNLKDIPFPHLLSEKDAKSIIDDVGAVFKNNPVFSEDVKRI